MVPRTIDKTSCQPWVRKRCLYLIKPIIQGIKNNNSSAKSKSGYPEKKGCFRHCANRLRKNSKLCTAHSDESAG